MRHKKGFKTLNRTRAHRKALYRNMVEALFTNERIKTTEVKAKEIRRISEKIITRAKVKSLHNIRLVSKLIKDKTVLMKLFDEISPRYVDRPGGYTRVIKLAKRKGDGADMAYLELIEEAQATKKKKKKKKINLNKDTVKQEAKKEVEEIKEEEERKEEESKNTEVKDEAKNAVKTDETVDSSENQDDAESK